MDYSIFLVDLGGVHPSRKPSICCSRPLPKQQRTWEAAGFVILALAMAQRDTASWCRWFLFTNADFNREDLMDVFCALQLSKHLAVVDWCFLLFSNQAEVRQPRRTLPRTSPLAARVSRWRVLFSLGRDLD